MNGMMTGVPLDGTKVGNKRMKSTLVVDNDTTVHDVHTHTEPFLTFQPFFSAFFKF